ncbi:SRPBCC family protein [Candidatus Microgenomates bacterium]|nr:SRPBCC family protein [Candidatus Microgenomates bacterium]
MKDIISREITVHASMERVYKAISDPTEIITWFPDKIEGTLDVGQRPVMIFSGENHKTSIYVEAAKPFSYFAYRWVPGGAGIIGDVLKVPNTLVEFFIEESGQETKVTVRESGFTSLPAEVAEECFKQNSGGWEYMIGRLEKLLNKN